MMTKVGAPLKKKVKKKPIFKKLKKKKFCHGKKIIFSFVAPNLSKQGGFVRLIFGLLPSVIGSPSVG